MHGGGSLHDATLVDVDAYLITSLVHECQNKSSFIWDESVFHSSCAVFIPTSLSAFRNNLVGR